MRNPIFSADTLFLDQHNDGTVTHRTGVEAGTLSCGERIVRLETKQPLVELITESGGKLVMSPETAFALEKDNGLLMRYAPVDTAYVGCAAHLGWRAPVNVSAHRRWALAGMVCASGTHSFERSRATAVTVPLELAPDIVRYLETVSLWNAQNGHAPLAKVFAKEVEGGMFIRSRALTAHIGSILTDKTQSINFEPTLLARGLLWAFLKGLLSTSHRVGNVIVFSHRVAATVKALSSAMWTEFGVPSKLMINPMESGVTAMKSGIMPHQFRLSAEQRGLATLAGLDIDVAGTISSSSFHHVDRVVSVKPLDAKLPSVIVLPSAPHAKPRKYRVTANSFAFSPQFSLPAAAVEIATHPVFVDSSDPLSF